MAIQATDLLRVNRGSVDYQLALSNKGKLQVTDLVAVNRGGVDYQVAWSDRAKLQNTDLLALNRGGVDYQVPWSLLKSAFGTAPVISGKAEVGQILTLVSEGKASGGVPPFATVTVWQISDDGGSTWTDISGVTGKTYLLDIEDRDKYVRVLSTITDAAGQVLELGSEPPLQIMMPLHGYLGWNERTDRVSSERWRDGYDTYEDRVIDTQARMRRCLVTDTGVVTYLDGRDSTKLAGEWVWMPTIPGQYIKGATGAMGKVYESLTHSEKNGCYYYGLVGTSGSMLGLHNLQPNKKMEAGAKSYNPWDVTATYSKGDYVKSGANYFECVVPTSSPGSGMNGTTAAVLDGSAGQVMVEIPKFSVLHLKGHIADASQHEFFELRGSWSHAGFVTHPAFVRPDGTERDFIYVGAYPGSGADGVTSASGATPVLSADLQTAKTACAKRGAGWHQLTFQEYNAIYWLMLLEWQCIHLEEYFSKAPRRTTSQLTGLSNSTGNNSVSWTKETVVPTAYGSTVYYGGPEYMSYRGLENIYSTSSHLLDGIHAGSTDDYAVAADLDLLPYTQKHATAGSGLARIVYAP